MTNGRIYITGASGGLGLELAKLLIDCGGGVTSLSRTKPTDERIDHIALDLTDEKSIEHAAKIILDKDEKISMFINCAGVMTQYDDEHDFPPGEISRVYRVNVEGPIYLTSLLLNKIMADGADVINVSSTNGLRGQANRPVYGSSKWAMRGYTKSLQDLFKDSSCRAVDFVAGGFLTNMSQKTYGRPLSDPENWPSVSEMAGVLLGVITTPKSFEISEIVVNRKTGSR